MAKEVILQNFVFTDRIEQNVKTMTENICI